MSNTGSLNPGELTLIAGLVAFLISKNKNALETDAMSTIFLAIGALLESIAAQKRVEESKNDIRNKIDQLKNEILQLERNL